MRNILDYPSLFSPPARTVTLVRNYRSTQSILDATNAVIGLAAERFTKDLWSERASDELPRLVTVADEADQARYVVEEVLERREAAIALKSQAVLFRASSHSAVLELELVRRNIPYIKFGGLKFLEAAHVKDVLAFLRLLRTRAIASRVSGCCNCCPASARRPRRVCSTRWRVPIPPTSSPEWHRRTEARTSGPCSRHRSGSCAVSRPAGPPNSSGSTSGTNRTCSADTRTPTCGSAICASSRRSPRVIRRANDSSRS